MWVVLFLMKIFLVKHYISNDKKDLIKLRSSKYLQSNLEGFYKEVRGLLKIGEKSFGVWNSVSNGCAESFCVKIMKI